MPGILGKKIGMTRVTTDTGEMIPVTVIQCEPNVVTQVKTEEKDGYSALVLGAYKRKKPKKTSKFYFLREFEPEEEIKKGDEITVEKFKEIKTVSVCAKSKGKGTQGTIKRYNFSRGPETHGSHHHREPGSVGACAKPGRVARGKKLPGRMGNENVTRKHIPVVSIDTENNLICLKGPVPGSINNLIIIKAE